jgi:Lrp/AsnC family leucine-responsive transcriptional regulator
MRELDETDLDILRALMADARRSWADIAEEVDLSPPAVSDRVDRLQELGVIRRFTLDVDRSQLREGVRVLVRVDPAGPADAVREAFRDAAAVEHVFATADGDVVCHARVPDGDVPDWLSRVVDDGAVADYEVTLLTDAAWTPSLGGTTFALTCAECGNTVTSEGTSARVGGERHRFCCPSCEARFVDRYERLEAGVDGDADGA